MKKIYKLCWQCGKRLYDSYATIEFNGSQIAVHKTCREDAENLLLKNKVTFRGQDQYTARKERG